jgi:predicted DNA-binding protein (UPF0251 family)
MVTIGGVERRMLASEALRFEVVRGVLVGSLTLAQGARRMRVAKEELGRLVDGARRAVIAAGLESELAAADGGEHVRREPRVLGLSRQQHV